MGRAITYPQFHNEDSIKYFFELCKKASYTGVKWRKFLLLDKRNKSIFQDIKYGILSMQYRKLTYAKNNICWQCSVEEAAHGGYCEDCYNKIKQLVANKQKEKRKCLKKTK